MKFRELLEIVDDEPVFDTGFLVSGRGDEPGLPAQLSRWCRSGRLSRHRRNLFSLAPPYQKVVPHPFLVANRIVPGSYVSTQSALAHAGAIPEYVPEITSCGPGRPQVRRTPMGRYSFRYLTPSLRTGYRLMELAAGQRAFVATAEKALLDLIHLQPGGDDAAWVNGLRLNLETICLERLMRTARLTGRPKLIRAANHLAAGGTPRP